MVEYFRAALYVFRACAGLEVREWQRQNNRDEQIDVPWYDASSRIHRTVLEINDVRDEYRQYKEN